MSSVVEFPNANPTKEADATFERRIHESFDRMSVLKRRDEDRLASTHERIRRATEYLERTEDRLAREERWIMGLLIAALVIGMTLLSVSL